MQYSHKTRATSPGPGAIVYIYKYIICICIHTYIGLTLYPRFRLNVLSCPVTMPSGAGSSAPGKTPKIQVLFSSQFYLFLISAIFFNCFQVSFMYWPRSPPQWGLTDAAAAAHTLHEQNKVARREADAARKRRSRATHCCTHRRRGGCSSRSEQGGASRG